MTGTRTLLVAALLVISSFGVVATPAAATPANDSTTAGCSFPFTATDATGTEVTLEEAPERVVTAGPASAQTMWEIGAQAKVVGTTQYAKYLDGAETTANISGSGYAFISVEKVIAQQPDLVLAASIVPDEKVEKLRQADITVYKYESASSLDDVIAKTELTGKLVGACDGAAETVDWMETERKVVEQAAEGKEPKQALYVFYGSTPGPNTYISDLMTTAGATNLAADADLEYSSAGYARLNPEVVANMSVEWLLLNSGQPEPRIPDSEAYQNTMAVQQNQTIVMDENRVSQPAPRSFLVMRQLSKTWYPDAYAEANASVRGEAEVSTGTTATTEATTAMSTTASTETTAEPASNGSPGFTAVGAVAALTALGALARRD
ncbi:PGF-CTERM-anchored ABC transporter substrate-binding protein [Haloarchaeobius sp. HME9146]|uniref:PGF-CTERM-anchored ABC transporter substrate-binding protein n=1 Tax=Haloarchaeobius sp. HME9146 TaxID=2978732 RepID=UPI0021C1103B|nr:PGF-CTERM-anchored ABC transporter substrate-binding protein [Haloarchaeobius sp. HME9146]MCT9096504.1 PGF-CTERM-anchored ABC transporter substrate-binding protein [Haloarchaeobius sp. HME9146]